MDPLDTLNALGIAMPTPAYLIGSVLFGIIGFIAYRYGKKRALVWPRWLGVALMFYPYAVSQAWLLYLIGIGLCIALYLVREQ